MNPDTGELRGISSLVEMTEARKHGFSPVPKSLHRAAKKKLNGKKKAYVSMTSGGKLSRHAAKLRKRRRQMAKDSRRKNR